MATTWISAIFVNNVRENIIFVMNFLHIFAIIFLIKDNYQMHKIKKVIQR